jgi:hypothetical protein
VSGGLLGRARSSTRYCSPVARYRSSSSILWRSSDGNISTSL